MSDRNLTIRLQNGDQKALEEIYWLYCEELHQLAIKFLRERQLAEDAVQQIFLNLWKIRFHLDPDKSIKGFLFISLKNHVLNMLKKNKRRIIRQYEYVSINTPVPEETDSSIICSELQLVLNNCLNRLPEVKRKVYELKMLGEFSNYEIAKRLGLSENTVKSHYYLAKKSIREYMTLHQKLP